MPHPTPAQLAYGSVTVISLTLAALLLAPTGSVLALTVIAVTALLLGAAVAVTAVSRRAVRRTRAAVLPPVGASERPGVRV
jgi:hypothetical protein